MANRYASGQYAKAICDRCGLEYPLLELQFESLAAKGVPNSALSELRVCWKCFDEPHPQAFLPDAVRAKLPDAQQLWKPRPDIFPVAYPVNYNLPGTMYSNNYPSLSLPLDFSGPINAQGVFAGYSATIPSPPTGITASSVVLHSSLLVTMILSVSGSAPLGTVEMFVVDGQGNSLGGLINIVA